MEHQDEKAKALLDRYLQGQCTPDEQQLVESVYVQYTNNKTIKEKDIDFSRIGEESWKTIALATQTPSNRTYRLWPRIAAAASILLVCSIGGYFLLHQKETAPLVQNQPEQIGPKQQGITLIAANGKQTLIDPKHTGKIQTQDGSVANQQGSSLDYQQEKQANSNAQEAKSLTLANNSGTKFNLTLSDGTEAILDAHSTIRYPATFTGKQRQVTITGQAYFKVKHNEQQPFLVTAKNETIEDIGTEFNVDAYEEDATIKTTLVQGAVKINQKLFLKPGEQAIYSNNELTTKTADLEATLSWLQGKLIFNHEPLESILKRVARVYDVNFIFEDENLKIKKFNGQVSETRKLANVLNFFRKTGEVNFLVEGKTVKVFKKKK